MYLIGFRSAEKSINTIISNGKRFMAYELLKRLQAQSQLAAAVSPSDRHYKRLMIIYNRALRKFSSILIAGSLSFFNYFIWLL